MQPITAKEIISKYPLLFQPREFNAWASPWRSLGVGAGWNGILESLCHSLYEPYLYARNHYERMRKVEGRKPAHPKALPINAIDVERARLAMRQAELELPRFIQIKEKFGVLRVYLDHADERIVALTDTAETLSKTTCEECGAPGQLRSGGWLKTLCDEHARPAKAPG